MGVLAWQDWAYAGALVEQGTVLMGAGHFTPNPQHSTGKRLKICGIASAERTPETPRDSFDKSGVDIQGYLAHKKRHPPLGPQ
jgi:hypothetical protein